LEMEDTDPDFYWFGLRNEQLRTWDA
jgi:hypothetical protein